MARTPPTAIRRMNIKLHASNEEGKKEGRKYQPLSYERGPCTIIIVGYSVTWNPLDISAFSFGTNATKTSPAKYVASDFNNAAGAALFENITIRDNCGSCCMKLLT